LGRSTSALGISPKSPRYLGFSSPMIETSRLTIVEGARERWVVMRRSVGPCRSSPSVAQRLPRQDAPNRTGMSCAEYPLASALSKALVPVDALDCLRRKRALRRGARCRLGLAAERSLLGVRSIPRPLSAGVLPPRAGRSVRVRPAPSRRAGQ
jgi:hypothetical protein